MKKMIDAFGEEGARIQDEIEEQVRTELGLTGISVDDMTDDDFLKYKEAVISRCEVAGVSSADVVRILVLPIAIKALREHGDDEKAKLLEEMLRRGEN